MSEELQKAIDEAAYQTIEDVAYEISFTWDQLLELGELEGYEQGWGSQIDFDYATDTPCDKCGGQCHFYAMNNDRGSYRAFKVCTQCNHAVEF